MISYEEALKIVLDEPMELGTEHLALESLSDRILAADVRSEYDLPLFDNSAMDGYAVHCPVEGPLHLVGEVRAGDSGDLAVGPGTAARVFTGAAIPAGANAVVMQEVVTAQGGTIRIGTDVTPGDYIRRRGDEFRVGQTVVSAGTCVNPAVLGCLAAAGASSALAWKRPTIAIVETGSELIRPGEAPLGGSVFAANGLGLAAAGEAFGGKAIRFTAEDDESAIVSVLREALDQADIVITSGGVSVGDYDLVRPALKSLGVEERFWRAAIRPGRPCYFGRRPGGAVVFGLPGNPGSSTVTFLLFVRPFLMRLYGMNGPSWFDIGLDRAIEPAALVDTFMRVKIRGSLAVPVEKQGSNMISSVMLADALIQIPRGDAELPKGTMFKATAIDWGL